MSDPLERAMDNAQHRKLVAEIERLRAELNEFRNAAADEIERLRAENKRLKASAGVELSEENDHLIDEIERLRAEINDLGNSLVHHKQEADRLRVELELVSK